MQNVQRVQRAVFEEASVREQRFTFRLGPPDSPATATGFRLPPSTFAFEAEGLGTSVVPLTTFCAAFNPLPPFPSPPPRRKTADKFPHKSAGGSFL